MEGCVQSRKVGGDILREQLIKTRGFGENNVKCRAKSRKDRVFWGRGIRLINHDTTDVVPRNAGESR
jgi:hypothetical protein